jgi:hypothetical protein
MKSLQILAMLLLAMGTSLAAGRALTGRSELAAAGVSTGIRDCVSKGYLRQYRQPPPRD